MKHKAVIVGCGRIGVGRNWIETPYVYTHAGAYAALKDRVSLEAVVDADPGAVAWAKARWGVPGYTSLDSALAETGADIVSVCTPPDPDKRLDLFFSCWDNDVKGVWCEKPWALAHKADGLKAQVNYIRRFDPAHQGICTADELWVWAKRDVHTVCHFTDLARYWEIKRENLHYFHMDGPNSYVARRKNLDKFFPLGGVVGGFMEGALANLLDAVEGRAGLISPPESAIESEKWAKEILDAKA